MHFEKVRIGMKVKITSIKETHKIYNSNTTMEGMVGGIYTVAEILTNHRINFRKSNPFKIKFVEQTRFVWDPCDLEYPGQLLIRPEGGTFDPKNLVV